MSPSNRRYLPKIAVGTFTENTVVSTTQAMNANTSQPTRVVRIVPPRSANPMTHEPRATSTRARCTNTFMMSNWS